MRADITPFDERNAWEAEGDAIDLSDSDYDVAETAELPAELHHHYATSRADPNFWTEFDEWFESLYQDQTLLVAIEQSCSEGILLPWDMRGVRLQSAPYPVLCRLQLFFDRCPRHVAVHLNLFVYWLVRAERARRRGTPEWSPLSPLPPSTEPRAFFRPSTLTIRRYPT
jgi:hypothetical protein